MNNRRATEICSLVALAALAAVLALPGRGRTGSGERRAASAPAAVPSAEERAFAALLADGTAATKPLLQTERQRLLADLRGSGAPALQRFLEERVAKSPAERTRLLALECLAETAGVEPRVLVRLATPAAESPSPALRAALRAAVARRLACEARAFGGLQSAWQVAGNELRAELLAAVGGSGDPAGLEFLAWVTTFALGELDEELADACVRLVPCARAPGAREPLERLCGLLESADTTCVQTVSLVLARARVDAAVPSWIERLESGSRGLRERARQALEEHSGLALGPDAARWNGWYEGELAWLEAEYPAWLDELESDEVTRVLAAVRALAGHRLRRHEVAEALAPLLYHPESVVRVYTCRALEGLGSALVVPALLDALTDDDEAVASGAWSALRRLTGLDLPSDAALWRERCAG